MPDTTLYRGDTRLNINPDNGIISIQMGPLSLRGFCRAEVSLTGKRPLTVSADEALELFRDPVSDVNGSGERIAVRFADGPFDLGIRFEAVIYDEQPFIALRIGVMNHGVDQVRIHNLTVFETEQFEMGEGPLDGWVNGYHSWCFTGHIPHTKQQPRPTFGFMTRPFAYNTTTDYPKRAGQYVGEQVAALIEPGKQALIAGFFGVEDQFGQIYFDGRPRHRSMIIRNETDKVPTISGEMLWSEWAILYRVKLPNPDPLRVYGDAITRLTPSRIPSPYPAPGWSSWYQFFQDVTGEHMERNQYVLGNMRDQLPISVIQLDDGYQKQWGDWLEHNNKFSEGVGSWAASVRSDGFEAGLWLSPLTVTRKSSIFKDYPEAVLRSERGKPANGGWLYNRHLFGLDPTHPATQEYLIETIETLVHHWGIRYLKLDFLYTGALPGMRHNPLRTRAQALRDGLTLIRETVGDEVTLLGCGCPMGPAVGIVDIMRVSPDVAPYWLPQVLGIGTFTRDDRNLPGARNSISATLNKQWTHRRLWWIDADNLLVREEQQLNADEVKTLTTVAGLSESHIVLSDDLPVTSYERLNWASKLLPIIEGDTEIPDLFEHRDPPIIIKRFYGASGPHVVVAFINWHDTPTIIQSTRQELGLPADIPVLAFDYWNRQVGTTSGDTFDTDQIPPHGVQLFALRPMVHEPQYVGSDLHISMGGEITEWQNTADTLRFVIHLGRKEKGSIWLRLPQKPVASIVDGNHVSIKPTGRNNIYILRTEVDAEAEILIRMS